ncbi:hypothetical protein [Natronolimnobius baerhuensis]|uniref:Uncharacterized protein n=1 Tax=Natronolimnobius baerhuensis TaxID=253108 RepID=A0A202E7Y3_9EURY|nr:hypothetical protein [Natronolimnobius baerhuensis]OVE84371.1 hypothetical protein B2G88_08125 [Natronolimnobius baerhuensis]
MFRRFLARVREWVSIADPDERIDGSGEAIVSPQHRRSLEADRELERLSEHAEDRDREQKK